MSGTTQTRGLTRRQIITRGAAAGAVAWAAPSVATRGIVHASSPSVCPGPGQGGKPNCIALKWSRPAVWGVSSGLCAGWGTQQSGVTVSGGLPPSGASMCFEAYGSPPGNFPNLLQTGTLSEGGTFCIPLIGTQGGAGVNNVRIVIKATKDGKTTTHTVEFHTSCSTPLCVGQIYSGFEVMGFCPNGCAQDLTQCGTTRSAVDDGSDSTQLRSATGAGASELTTEPATTTTTTEATTPPSTEAPVTTDAPATTEAPTTTEATTTTTEATTTTTEAPTTTEVPTETTVVETSGGEGAAGGEAVGGAEGGEASGGDTGTRND